MRFDIFTLFPDYFTAPFGDSILNRGRQSGALELNLHDIRDWAHDKHRTCDDYPYGGGAGMVLKAEPVAAAMEEVLRYKAREEDPPCPVILMSPQGRTFTHEVAQELARKPRIALLCGHYEGIDERVIEMLVTDEISIGDFVLTGGEPAATCIVDAVARLVPGVLGNADSAVRDSFAAGLLEAPHYTRPDVWRDLPVPEILLSGNHGEIERWRVKEGMKRTLKRRPDLLDGLLYGGELSPGELEVLGEVLGEYQAPFRN
jgi:tRNA (guanine37-N1)-methyltransferase